MTIHWTRPDRNLVLSESMSVINIVQTGLFRLLKFIFFNSFVFFHTVSYIHMRMLLGVLIDICDGDPFNVIRTIERNVCAVPAISLLHKLEQ